MDSPSIEALAKGLSKAQRAIMLGHLCDIPPEEADALCDMGLKGEHFFHEQGDSRRMVWPITPLGLALRTYLERTQNG